MKELKTALILDRDRDVTVVTADLLQDCFKDFSIVEANTPEDGIRILKENPIDLVIMDLFIVDGIRMSKDIGNIHELPIRTLFHTEKLHGDQIIEEIKKYRPKAKIMIYSTESPYDWHSFMSMHQSVAARRVLDLGFDGFLKKVSDPSAFIKMVEDLLNIKAKKKLEL